MGVEYDLDNNVFNLLDSNEELEHPLGAPNVIKPPAKTVLEPEMAFVAFYDSYGDYMLSDYKSDDDDYSLLSNDESASALAKMELLLEKICMLRVRNCIFIKEKIVISHFKSY